MLRAAGWLVFVIALAGLGALIHAGAPPVPRWRERLPAADDDFISTAAHVMGGRFSRMPHSGRGGRAGPLEVRDVETGRVLLSTWGDGAHVGQFAFSPGGGWAARVTGPGADAALWCLDLSTGRERRTRLGPSSPSELYFSPDDRLLLLKDAGGLVRVFDPGSGAQVAELKAADPFGRSWAGPWLLLPWSDGVHAWDTRTRAGFTIPAVPGMAFAGGVTQRALVATARGAELWSLDGRPGRLAEVRMGSDCQLSFSEDGRLAFIAPEREQRAGPLQVWDAVAGYVSQVPARDGRRFACAADGRLVAVGTATGGFDIFDARSGRLAWTLPTGAALQAIAPDSTGLVLDEPKAVITVRDAEAGAPRGTLLSDAEAIHTPEFRAGGRQLWLWSLPATPAREGWLGALLAWLRPPPPPGRAWVLVGRDWPSLRIVLRIPGGDGGEFHVADDGSFVITTQDEGASTLLERWDIPETKPWASVIGVPVAAGACLLGLRAWWGRRPGAAQPEDEARPFDRPAG